MTATIVCSEFRRMPLSPAHSIVESQHYKDTYQTYDIPAGTESSEPEEPVAPHACPSRSSSALGGGILRLSS